MPLALLGSGCLALFLSFASKVLRAREKKEIGGRPQTPAKGLPPLRTLLLPDLATALPCPERSEGFGLMGREILSAAKDDRGWLRVTGRTFLMHEALSRSFEPCLKM